MKKFLLLTAVFFVLSNCEIRTRTVSANSLRYEFRIENRDGMRFGVWSVLPDYSSSQTGYNVAVVNLTKDALEVELLKLQISELHNKLHKSK